MRISEQDALVLCNIFCCIMYIFEKRTKQRTKQKYIITETKEEYQRRLYDLFMNENKKQEKLS